ncbi:hypothetical protein A2697_02890 [Candidatus Curtissbacteria bacterium RIFCSPHIGHO2_01_FULL_41_44]|uniref:Metallo-beta-lactamase domain-containing protein n=1 Tax=Candidatus Curtissbacteria bacterium RIFCSPLOWO2_01_FULL_42_50 TaxID=1797730 RepID=A0A1F5H881_9BACT|nr:MAG: hypothetical protein A2697_02890 [Candidatus Curtissbacteria bacterium RIFCSPHIGHO2_01_FULL_41_44]OGD93033.1 MAG: hypothetical protein A3C33_01070 [Candidatus Curtissbacteria bacterium RIFCSPHIGHO2_02_FULL_42_58]OGD97041.1 MAG: hypothetical protein A3E71_02360 [Candidatus Curtissbacteria bacterium RIFCSPHIGHO2_12_FULL_42_33]OGE00270.1 MAG: hypothetical protein A3B54_00835 [Candidatus Curtissbacteria bacterium RIFCSPLOWO2_01_FULL_42_50]OGE03066.1 MAG: hypothetical protein A3G16_04225 [Ca
MDQKTRFLLTLALIFVGLGLALIFQTQSLGKLRIIACDVGQGDGLLVITPGGRDVVIDGGPGSKIIDCLSQKMPFWDRSIDLMVVTHPQKDHMAGLLEVLARYKVKMIATTQVKNDTELFRAWQEATKNEGAKIYIPNIDDRLMLETLNLQVLWPGRGQIDQWGKSQPKDLNETSIVLRLEYGNFCAYLTGDIPKEIFVSLTLQGVPLQSCQVLKVAHHGSKTGTNQEIIDLVKPAIAVIQVGKNSFGHPHKEVTDLLQSKGVKILRNDTNGIIEVESDGRSFKVKSEK